MLIGITGSEGFIGGALASALEAAGHGVRRFDVALPIGDAGRGDVLDRAAVARFAEGCDGLIHLAAVARVAQGELDPAACIATNVDGTANVLAAAAASTTSRGSLQKPWILFASSREVYGEPRALPVREDAALDPINTYGRSKAAAEALVMAARASGIATAVLRFTNVYGPGRDHPDRVVPAFARAAARGSTLFIQGQGNTFDFTHITDVTRGVLTAVTMLASGERAMPAVHLASGRGTTLIELANLARGASPASPRVVVEDARAFAVSRFIGDPSLARQVLGWSSLVPIEDGIREAVADAGDDRTHTDDAPRRTPSSTDERT